MDARGRARADRHILLVQDLRSGAIFAVDNRGYVSDRLVWLAATPDLPLAWHTHLTWSHYEPECWQAVCAGDPAEYRVLATWPPQDTSAAAGGGV